MTSLLFILDNDDVNKEKAEAGCEEDEQDDEDKTNDDEEMQTYMMMIMRRSRRIMMRIHEQDGEVDRDINL